ncbi:MAG: KOW motif-containing protein [Sphingorhabdus sp.]|uniref:KOW motif-containing protein n=1 Tax=Sphingorhabdus sp. TaxID=1902408 RepID=UPI003CA1483A
MTNGKVEALQIADGDYCTVIAGVHKGKAGIVRDINRSKSGNVTITVVQDDGERFKTLARSVLIGSN